MSTVIERPATESETPLTNEILDQAFEAARNAPQATMDLIGVGKVAKADYVSPEQAEERKPRHLETESARAQQAWEDYYNLGSGRSLERLLETYQTKPSEKVPTKQLATLKRWSASFNWVDRCMGRMAREAEQAEAATVAELAEHKKARIAEARGLRQLGRSLMTAMLAKIKQGDLNAMPLFDRMVLGADGKYHRELGLSSVMPQMIKSLEIGQKLERIETGEEVDGKFEALIEALIMDMSPEEQREVRVMAARLMAEKDGK